MSPTADEAHYALVEAAASRRLLAAKGRWPRLYLVVYALCSAAAFVLIGLGGNVGILIGCIAWPTLILVMQRRSRLRPVTERGGRQSISVGAIAWGAVYVVALGVGYGWFRDQPWYWAPAAILVASPFVIAALRKRPA